MKKPIKKAQGGLKIKKPLKTDEQAIKEAKDYRDYNKKHATVSPQKNPMQPTLASMGFLNKTKAKNKPNPVLAALAKKNGGKLKK